MGVAWEGEGSEFWWHDGYSAPWILLRQGSKGPVLTSGDMLSVLQGVGRRHTAMDPAGVQHAQHQDGRGASPGAAGPEAAAEAGQGDGHLPSTQGTLLTVFWWVGLLE